MWIETRKGLVNTDHIQKITAGSRFVYFYKPETPATGEPMKDLHRDLVGDIECASEDAARDLYAEIRAQLTAERRTP